jgi:hypothetical protein
MRLVEHVSIVGWIRNVRNLVVTKYEGATWERGHTREDNIQMELRK